MGPVQGRHGADRGGVLGEHAIGAGRVGGVPRVDHQQEGWPGVHEALEGRPRLDVAAHVDHGLASEVP